MESPVPDMLGLRRQNLPQKWTKAQQEREMQVPVWLVNLISRCLEKKPEGRYSDGTELHEIIAQSSIAEIKTEVVREIAAEAVPVPAIAPPEGKMTISTGVFATLVILLVGSLAYNTYTVLTRGNAPQKVITQVAPDSLKKADSTPVVPIDQNIAKEKKQKMTDSATKSAIEDVIKSEQNKAANPDSTGNDTLKQ